MRGRTEPAEAPDPAAEEVATAFEESRERYGARKIKASLARRGIVLSRRRIMKGKGLVSAYADAKSKPSRPSADEADVPNTLLGISGTKYLFIDEVQNIGGFEDVPYGFRTEGGFSIFITTENIVYRYALAQDCRVSVGRIGKLECDFILRNPEMGYAYVQVAMTIMANRSTEEREYRPFEQVRDNYPKYLLTRSDPIQQRDGIIHANIPEFMKNGKKF